VIHTKVNGKMIKLMDMVYVSMLKVVQDMKDTGKKICNMVQVYKSILMVIDFKVCLNKVKNVDKVLIIYLMEPSIKVNGLMVESKVKVSVNGKMVEDIKVHG
jgi:hypothetical protein